MKNIILFLFFAFLTVFSAEADNDWEDVTHGLGDLDLQTVAVAPDDPQTAYVGSLKGVFKTTDGAGTWQEVFTLRGTLRAINFISINPQDSRQVYIGTQDGLYRSVNSGRDWQEVLEVIDAAERNVLCMCFGPQDTKVIYAGTRKGLFRSEDGGANWQKLPAKCISRFPVYAVSSHPVEREVIFAATPRGVFKTIDKGTNWKRVFTTRDKSTLVSDIADSAGDEIRELYKGFYSIDEIREGLEDSDTMRTSREAVTGISIDAVNREVIFLGTLNGPYASYDSGETWTKLEERGLVNRNIRFILSSSYVPGVVYTATREGVFVLSPEQGYWHELYSGLVSKDIRALALSDKGGLLWAATGKGVFRVKSLDSNNYRNFSRDEMELREVFDHFSHEPSIAEIQKAAIRYAEVIDPKRIGNLRKSARFKALLPDFDLDYDKNIWHKSSTSDYWTGPTDWSVGLSWDIGDLVYSEQQRLIDSQVRLMVELRDDILDEVTRIYFERRKLQIDLFLSPPKDLNTKLDKELRLQELTADIDALTGGYLSYRLEKQGHIPFY